jgi:hypothetical protein
MHDSRTDASKFEEKMPHQRRFPGIHVTHDDQVEKTLVTGLDPVDLGVLFDGVDLLLSHFDDGTEITKKISELYFKIDRKYSESMFLDNTVIPC